MKAIIKGVLIVVFVMLGVYGLAGFTMAKKPIHFLITGAFASLVLWPATQWWYEFLNKKWK